MEIEYQITLEGTMVTALNNKNYLFVLLFSFLLFWFHISFFVSF